MTHMNDNNNFDCSSKDSSFEHDPSDNDMVSIPDDYCPENGAEIDGDTGKCCHWSIILNNRNKIDLADGMAPHGSPRVVIPDDTTPADNAKQVLDDDFIDMAINCTNIGNIPCDEKCKAFMCGYLANRTYLESLISSMPGPQIL